MKWCIRKKEGQKTNENEPKKKGKSKDSREKKLESITFFKRLVCRNKRNAWDREKAQKGEGVRAAGTLAGQSIGELQ